MPPTYGLTRLSRWRWNQAIAKLWIENHDDGVQEIQDLLNEKLLPWLLRLKANVLLVDVVDDWYLAEEYRRDAEQVYAHIRLMYPVGDTEFPAQEQHLVALRAELDTPQIEQADNKPWSDDE